MRYHKPSLIELAIRSFACNNGSVAQFTTECTEGVSPSVDCADGMKASNDNRACKDGTDAISEWGSCNKGNGAVGNGDSCYEGQDARTVAGWACNQGRVIN